MKKFVTLALSFALVGILSACGGGEKAQPAPTPEQPAAEAPAAEAPAAEAPSAGGTVDAAAAEEKYKTSCLACHGVDLSGGAGPSLKQVGSKYSQEQIAGIIINGKEQCRPAC